MSVASIWARAAVGLVVLLPAAPRAQMPPQPGKLVISSEPSGAIVKINGHGMDQHTNAVFAVSAGEYRVAVSSADGALACPEIKISVASGQTAARLCTAKGWQ